VGSLPGRPDGQDPLAAGPARAAAVREMFDRIAPRYDALNRLLTFGLDARWRARTAAALALPEGSIVIDVACGTGMLTHALRTARHRAVGMDVSAGMLARAGPGLRLVRADGLALPFGNGIADGVTCGFALRNVVDLRALLAEMARVLREGGRVALLEVAEPELAPARAVHRLYFQRVVPVVGGLLSDRAAYRYLPRSTVHLPDAGQLVGLLETAGFTHVERRLLGAGAAQLLTATRRQGPRAGG
jgi:demethylmenaquinone methyltransferase / 2-methoxy-6-polyprenyl-1,4-benzoquinol methylase